MPMPESNALSISVCPLIYKPHQVPVLPYITGNAVKVSMSNFFFKEGVSPVSRREQEVVGAVLIVVGILAYFIWKGRGQAPADQA